MKKVVWGLLEIKFSLCMAWPNLSTKTTSERYMIFSGFSQNNTISNKYGSCKTICNEKFKKTTINTTFRVQLTSSHPADVIFTIFSSIINIIHIPYTYTKSNHSHRCYLRQLILKPTNFNWCQHILQLRIEINPWIKKIKNANSLKKSKSLGWWKKRNDSIWPWHTCFWIRSSVPDQLYRSSIWSCSAQTAEDI